MESEEKRKKTVKARREVAQRIGILLVILYLMIATFILVGGVVQALIPVTVVFLVLEATLFITTYKEEWFYPKRKTKPSRVPK